MHVTLAQLDIAWAQVLSVTLSLSQDRDPDWVLNFTKFLIVVIKLVALIGALSDCAKSEC